MFDFLKFTVPFYFVYYCAQNDLRLQLVATLHHPWVLLETHVLNGFEPRLLQINGEDFG